jgi:hypothetical protein
MLGKFADDKEFAFQGILFKVTPHKDLFDSRFRGEGDFSGGGVVNRHIAIANEFKAFVMDMAIQDVKAEGGFFFYLRKEYQSGGIPPWQPGVDAQCAGDKCMGDLDKDAGPVTRGVVGAGGSAVIHIEQDVKPPADDLMRGLPLDVGDKTNAATVVFVSGMVKPPGLWKWINWHIQCFVLLFI